MGSFFNKNKPIYEIFTGNETDDEIVKQINGIRTINHRLSSRTRRQWLLNSAFARGQQFMILRRNEDRLVQPRVPGNRKLVMDNLIGPWKEAMIANLVTAIPLFEAIPSTHDADSVSAARLGSDLLNYYWEDWSFILQYITLSGYLADFGNAFIFLFAKIFTFF